MDSLRPRKMRKQSKFRIKRKQKIYCLGRVLKKKKIWTKTILPYLLKYKTRLFPPHLISMGKKKP